MQEKLDKLKNKFKGYGLDDIQIEDVFNDIYDLSMDTAHQLAQVEVESALNSIARFGR